MHSYLLQSNLFINNQKKINYGSNELCSNRW